MASDLQVAVEAARAGARLVARLVTDRHRASPAYRDVDQLSTAEMRYAISKLRRQDIVFSEEDENVEADLRREREPYWLLDPLDGSRNFQAGYPHYATVATRIEDGIPVAAAVVDVTRRTEYSCQIGSGVRQGQISLRADTHGTLRDAMVSYTFHDTQKISVRDWVVQMYTSGAKLRQTGSVALDSSYVTGGMLHGFVGTGLKPWDIAHALLFANSSGAIATRFDGHSANIFDTELLISGRELHHRLLRTISH